MTSYQIWNYIAMGAFAVAGIFLAIAAVIFFRAHILSVIAVLSGKAARKDIERIKTEIDTKGTDTGKFDFFEADKNAAPARSAGKYAKPKKTRSVQVAQASVGTASSAPSAASSTGSSAASPAQPTAPKTAKRAATFAQPAAPNASKHATQPIQPTPARPTPVQPADSSKNAAFKYVPGKQQGGDAEAETDLLAAKPEFGATEILKSAATDDGETELLTVASEHPVKAGVSGGDQKFAIVWDETVVHTKEVI
jgi:hypothetical protein